MGTFRPMLAYTDTPDDLREYEPHLPLLGSYKLDGIRSLQLEMRMASRSLKPIPSAYAHTICHMGYEGFDGELLIKPRELPPGETIYHATFSAVMTHGCTEPLDWWIFDYADVYFATSLRGKMAYEERYHKLKAALDLRSHVDVKLLEQRLLRTPEEIGAMEKEALDLGYEGLIVRRPDAPYHCNRSSWKQGYLMKVVRVLSGEARVKGFYEMMHNDNEATIDARGYTVRSSHQANLRPAGMLGGFHCQDIKTGIEFKCGLGEGLDHATRKYIWEHQPEFLDRIFTYTHKPYGTKDKPRQPKWKGWRDPIDMS